MSDTILKVDNVHSTLVTNDHKLKEFLGDKLRFRPKNFWRTPAYIAKKWDGWEYFFDKKNGRFLTGILPEIQVALNALQKSYTLVDLRTKVKWLHESIDQNFLGQFNPQDGSQITLHDFQPDLVNQCIKYNRGIVKAPTGAGKTFLLIALIHCLPPKTPILFLTKNASLVHQNYLEMQNWNVPNLGRWYAKYKEPNYVMCCTVHKSTFESLAPILPKFKVLIVDEVHDCMSKVPITAYRKMKSACVRIGISATPYKWAKKKIYDCQKWDVKSHFGPILKTTTTASGHITTKELQDRKILTPSDCFIKKIAHPNLTYEPYHDAVKLGIEQNFYFHGVVAELAKSCPGRTLIVVERIQQGQYLNQLIPGSNFIYGVQTLKKRLPILNSLKSGEKTIAIIMRQIIKAGINIKIHDLINASGGEAAHDIIQLIGRGLRPANDKESLRYHDFLFLVNEYLEKHSNWRIEVLKKEGHNVTIQS